METLEIKLSYLQALIDAESFFSDRLQEKLRAFIDGTELGTIIVITENLHKQDDATKDGFRKLLVKQPVVADWATRAQAILVAEEVMFATAQVSNADYHFSAMLSVHRPNIIVTQEGGV